VKIFYAADRFMEISSNANYLLILRNVTEDELYAALLELEKKYDELKRIYVEYIEVSDEGYYYLKQYLRQSLACNWLICRMNSPQTCDLLENRS